MSPNSEADRSMSVPPRGDSPCATCVRLTRAALPSAAVPEETAQRVIRSVAATPEKTLLAALRGSWWADDHDVVASRGNPPDWPEFAALGSRKLLAAPHQLRIGHASTIANSLPRVDG